MPAADDFDEYGKEFFSPSERLNGFDSKENKKKFYFRIFFQNKKTAIRNFKKRLGLTRRFGWILFAAFVFGKRWVFCFCRMTRTVVLNVEKFTNLVLKTFP